MPAQISTKKSAILGPYLKRSADILKTAAGEYFTEAMPTTTGTIKGVKDNVSKFTSTRNNASIVTTLRQLKTQMSFRSINAWFLDTENDFDTTGAMDADLSFDIPIDDDDTSAQIAATQISAEEKNANKISKTFVETTHKLMESQISSTANILSSMDRIGATLATGFDNINDTLGKILEITTKNTSAIISMTASAQKEEQAAKHNPIGWNGKFDPKEYLKMVGANAQNNEVGMMLSMVGSMISSGSVKQMFSSQEVLGGLLKMGLNKAKPNLKKNLEEVDNAVSDFLISSLTRLGSNPNSKLGKVFGINTDRKELDTSRSKVELKAVPYDGISKEALTNAIPGYLRKILVQLGGPDLVYDYRSRTFKSIGGMRKEFQRSTAQTDTFRSSGSNIRKAMGGKYNNADFRDMTWDLMMEELSSMSDNQARKTISSFKKGGGNDFLNGIFDSLPNSSGMKKANSADFNNFIKDLEKINGILEHQLMNAVSTVKTNSSIAAQREIQELKDYNVDTTNFKDTHKGRKGAIYESYTGESPSSKQLRVLANSGVDYTNKALYEIHKRLSTGINVFQVGSGDYRSAPFKNIEMKPPLSHKGSNGSYERVGNVATSGTSKANPRDGSASISNASNEDGGIKGAGKNLLSALFSGNSSDVRAAMNDLLGEMSSIASTKVKGLLSKKNQEYGNISGYLKHKITGAEYSYIDDDGNEVKVAKNEKGGMLSYFDQMLFGEGGARGALKRFRNSSSKWFKSVAGYFNFSNKDDKNDSGDNIEGKRKRILSASIGALAGAGLLGGPLGLIMGAVAGNAIGSTEGIGGKIKKLLFGDEDKEKGKKKLGLIQKAVNGIVDPIRFQIGKTMTAFAGILKKNILGPLSNIGAAIKERMSNAAGGVVSKVFGKIFSGSFNLLKNIITLPLKIARAPITLMGKGARGAAEAGGAFIGGGLNSIAKSIAGKGGKDTINKRIAQQKADAAIDKANSGYYGDYERDENDELIIDEKTGKPKRKKGSGSSFKFWKTNEDEFRSKLNIDDFVAEDKSHKNKIIDKIDTIIYYVSGGKAGKKGKSENVKEPQEGDQPAQVTDDNSGLETMISKTGLVMMRSDKSKTGWMFAGSGRNASAAQVEGATEGARVSGDDSDLVNTMIGAGAQVISSDENISSEEESLLGGMLDSASKGKPNKTSIVTKFKDLLGRTKKKKESNNGEDKKENIFSKIFGGISTGFSWLKGALGGITSKLAGGLMISSLLGSDNLVDFVGKTFGEDNPITKAFTGLQNLSKMIGNVSKSFNNAVGGAISKVTSVIPGIPTINMPQFNGGTIFDGFGNAVMSSLYLKAGAAIGSAASAVASVVNAGTNMASKLGSGGGKYGDAFMKVMPYVDMAALGLTVLNGPVKHENTDAAGNEIVDQYATRNTAAKRGAKQVAWRGTKNAVNAASTILDKEAAHIAGDFAEKGITTSTKTLANGTTKATYNASKKSFEAAVTKGNRGAVGADIVEAIGGKAKNEVDDAILRNANNVAKRALSEAAEEGAELAGKHVDDVSKAKGLIAKLFSGVADFLAKNKTFMKYSAPVLKQLDKLKSKVLAPIGEKILEKAGPKLTKLLAKCGVNDAVGAATFGITYAVMAFGGALSGGLSAANIFGVREKDVDATMRTLSSVIVAMLQLPFLEYLELVDLVLIPLTGKSFRQWICPLLYNAMGGGEKLEEAQSRFNDDRMEYNAKFGTELSSSEYNDAVNKGMWAKMFGKGSVKTDAEGKALTDDAGEFLRTNHGVAGWFSSGEKDYARDANGEIIRDAKGKAIQKIDANGHKVYKDGEKKWTAHVGDWFHDVGGWFGGKKTYQMDENGNVMYDENGKPIVASKEKNIFGRIGSHFKDNFDKALDMGGFIKDIISGVTQYVKTGEKFNLNLNEDDPLYGPKRGITTAAGFISMPLAAIGKMGRKVAKFFKEKIINPIKGGMSDASKYHDAVVRGEYTIFNGSYWANTNKTSADNPLTPIQTIISYVERVLKAPSAMMGWIGNKVKRSFDNMVAQGAIGMEDATTDIEKVKRGEMSIFNKDYWKSDRDDTDNPIGKLSGLFGFMHRMSNALPAMVGYIATKAKAGYDKITNGCDKIMADAEATIKKAEGGSISLFSAEYWKAPQVPDNSPLGGLAVIASYFKKVTSAPGLLLKWAIGGVKSLGSTIKKKITDLLGIANDVADANGAFNVTTTSGTGGPEPGTYKSPINGGVSITSGFSNRTINGIREKHTGVDLVPANGSNAANVNAIDGARVVGIQRNVSDGTTGLSVHGEKSMGNYVNYQLADGTIIKNMHLRQGSIPSTLKVGDVVNPGQKIGRMGSTGRSDGNHLHFQVENRYGIVDPTSYLNGGKRHVGGPSLFETMQPNASNGWTTPLSATINTGTTPQARTIENTFSPLIAATQPVALQQIAAARNDASPSTIGDSADTPISGSTETEAATLTDAPTTTNTENLSPMQQAWKLVKEAGSAIANKFSEVFGLTVAEAHNSNPNAQGDEGLDGSVGYSGSGSYGPGLDGKITGPVEKLTTAEVVNAVGTASQQWTLIDLESGLSYQCEGGFCKTYHTDYTPITKEDVEIKKKTIQQSNETGSASGTWSWRPYKPTVLKIKDKQGKIRFIATSTHGFPHHLRMGGKSDNGLHNGNTNGPPWNPGGHFCLHYIDTYPSQGSSSQYRDQHTMVEKAYTLGNQVYKKSGGLGGPDEQAKVVDLARTFKGGARKYGGSQSNKPGYCTAWVEHVYEDMLGKGVDKAPDANSAYDHYGKSTDINSAPLGAAVYAKYTGNANKKRYGHAAIYLGNGQVASNINGTTNGPTIESVESFKSWAGRIPGYRGMKWGIHGGTESIFGDTPVTGSGASKSGSVDTTALLSNGTADAGSAATSIIAKGVGLAGDATTSIAKKFSELLGLDIFGTTTASAAENTSGSFADGNVDFNANADENGLGNLDIATDLPKLTESQIAAVITKHFSKSSVISPSDAKKVYTAQQQTGMSALAILGIGALESGWGTSAIAKQKKNLWGWNATNVNPGGNATTFGENPALEYAQKFMKTYYNGYGAKSIYATGTGNNPAGKGYAYHNNGSIDTSWATQVSSIMKTIYQTAKGSEGLGGPADDLPMGSISSSQKFTSKQTNSKTQGHGNGFGSKSSRSFRISDIRNSSSDIPNVGDSASGYFDEYGVWHDLSTSRGASSLGKVESALQIVVDLLRSINTNTGDSNDYLDDISKKEFGFGASDGRTSDALRRTNSRRSSRVSTYNQQNVNSVMKIVRPT